MSSPRSVLSNESPSGQALAEPIFDVSVEEFRSHFNRASLFFSHRLAGHPLFELPRLAKLSKILWPIGAATFCSANAPVGQGWNTVPSPTKDIDEAIARIEESGSWVLLKSIQKDPEYSELLEATLDELETLTGLPLRSEITWLEGYVFIASPRSVTPYHIDHEANVLMQIRGEKDISVFDPTDRSVLTVAEIERYYASDLSAARYREENQPKASVYHLVPGKGVHMPVRSPHWVQNGDAYSVSYSVNFCMRSYDRQARIYQANHYLRKLKLSPKEPGLSMFDGLKETMLRRPSNADEPKTKAELLRGGMARYERVGLLARRMLGRARSK